MALGFLQTQHIRLLFSEKTANQPDSQPDRIDIPGRNGNGHGTVVLRANGNVPQHLKDALVSPKVEQGLSKDLFVGLEIDDK
jgi:hypothetical protein